MMNRLFIACWLAVGAVAVAAPVPEQSARLARDAQVVFHSFHLFSSTRCYTAEELTAVEALEGIPDEDIDALLRSEDAHLIGVGLFLADERELPEFFLRYPEILRDRRPSPLVRCSSAWQRPLSGRAPNGAPAEGRYQSIARAVAEQYSMYLSDWYGVWAHDERMFHEHIAPDADPWLEVDTWRMVYDRAVRSEDPARVARVRERMLRAPEKIRWLLLARRPADHLPGGPGSFFPEEEVRKAMRELDPALQQAIREGTAPLTPRIERAIANNDEDPEAMRAQYYEHAKRLLEDPEQPRP